MEIVRSFLQRIYNILLYILLLFIFAPLYLLYSFTWRVKVFGDDEVISKYVEHKEGAIFAHWHGNELVLCPYYSYKKQFVLSSKSRDGSLMGAVLRLYGYRVFRGSSSRGGAEGLLSMIRAVKKESSDRVRCQCSLAVDGPRGPIYKVKSGIAQLSLSTELPILAVLVKADKFWCIPRAWNKAFIPKPFSRIQIYLGNPIFPPRDKSSFSNKERKEKLEELRFSVEKEFSRISALS